MQSAIKSVLSHIGFGAFETSISDLTNPQNWLTQAIGGAVNTSGVAVSPSKALSLSPYYAAIRNISEDIGKVPFITYQRLEPRGKRRATELRIFNLLKVAPNPDMSAMTFSQLLTHWALGWGNGYAEIQRNNNDEIIGLWPIHPARVQIMRDKVTMGIVYKVQVKDMDKSVRSPLIPARNMFHIHGMGDNGLFGYSVFSFASQTIGTGLAAESYAGAFFGSGSTVGGVLQYPGTLNDEGRENLRKGWADIHVGPENAFNPAILEQGLTWKEIGVPPKEAQFLEARQFQVVEIARWFRIPPHKIQSLDKATFSNIEEQNIDYVTDTLTSWFVRWEQEAARKLFPGTQQFFAEHLITTLLRGDQDARSKFYKALFNMASLSPNDVRELENLNPIPGEAGNQYYIQANMTTLDIVNEGRNTTVKTDENGEIVAIAPSLAQLDAAPVDSNNVNAQVDMHMPAFMDAAERVIKREKNAVADVVKKYSRVRSACDENGGIDPGTGKEYSSEDQNRDFWGWLLKFYGGHRDYIINAFKPSIEILAGITGLPGEGTPGEIAEIIAETISTKYCDAATLLIFNHYNSSTAEATLDNWGATQTAAIIAIVKHEINAVGILLDNQRIEVSNED